MHRDGPSAEFDPIERNIRRQTWWSIYVFEKILASILGRPTVIDDREMSLRVPDTLVLGQKTMSEEFMTYSNKVIKLFLRMRQEAYFDPVTAEERTPTIHFAESLLRECDTYLMGLPPAMSIRFPLDYGEDRATVLLHHIFYYYMRCIVSREFHIQKVGRDISSLENKVPNTSDGWEKILALSEDCVESAHNSIQCTMAGAHLGMIGYSWLNLFFVFHSILIVCADYLARPRDQHDSPKDIERKAMVNYMLKHIQGLKLAPTYTILHQITLQFASITGVSEEQSHLLKGSVAQTNDFSQEPQSVWRGDSTLTALAEMSESGGDWFSNATTTLGLDFFDFGQLSDMPSTYDDYLAYAEYPTGG
jgi:proline utilization trans-activator